MTEKQERPSFSVDFPSGEATFEPATKEAWYKYLTKFEQGESEAGAKSLLFSCCTSHKFDENRGEHELNQLLDEMPACIVELVDEIENITLCGESVEVDNKARTVKLLNMVFRAPKGREWSTFQENRKSDEIQSCEATEKLLLSLCDKPDVFGAFLVAHPTELGSIMVPISKLAGRGIKIKRKKA